MEKKMVVKVADFLAELKERAEKGHLSLSAINQIIEGELVNLGVVRRIKRRIAQKLQAEGKRIIEVKAKDEKGKPEIHYYGFPTSDLSKGSIQWQLFDELPDICQAALRVKEKQQYKKGIRSERHENINDYFFKEVPREIKYGDYSRDKYRETLDKAILFGIIKGIDKTKAEKLPKKEIIEFWIWSGSKRTTKYFRYCGRKPIDNQVFWVLKTKFQHAMSVYEQRRRVLETTERKERGALKYTTVGQPSSVQISPPPSPETPKTEETDEPKTTFKSFKELVEYEAREADKNKTGKKSKKGKGKPKGKTKGGRRGSKQNLRQQLAEELKE